MQRIEAGKGSRESAWGTPHEQKREPGFRPAQTFGNATSLFRTKCHERQVSRGAAQAESIAAWGSSWVCQAKIPTWRLSVQAAAGDEQGQARAQAITAARC